MAKNTNKTRKNPVSTREGRNKGTLNTGGTFENAGRPKGVLNRKTLFEKWNIATNAKNPLTEQMEQLTQDDIVILSLLNKARKGDVNAIRDWLDGRFGKQKDIVEIETIDKTKELTKEELQKEIDKLGLSGKIFDK